MTTATDTRPPATAPGGMAPDEKKAAVGFTVAGFLLGGPMGAVVAALAVGIEQAFARSGWDRPDWTRAHASMTPEEVAERRRQYAEAAAEYLRQARERNAARRAARKAHQERMRTWFQDDDKGDKPDRPDMRNPWELLRDFFASSKAWYRLFDEKMARGNVKVNDGYAAIGDFSRHLWNFFAGLYEGTREGWRQYQEDQRRAREEQQPATEPPAPQDDQQAQPEHNGARPDEPTTRPATELPVPDDLPAVTAPAIPDPEPAAGSSPAPEPGPLPPPARQQLPEADLSPGHTGPGGSPAIEGELMARDGTVLPMPADVPEHMGRQGATNLDLLHEAFLPARPVLASIPPQMTDLLQQGVAVLNRVRYIVMLANAVGAPLVVAQMIAECYALTNGVNAGLHDVQTHHGTAVELTEEALAGLAPADAEQDEIHSQGASGDALNRVGH